MLAFSTANPGAAFQAELARLDVLSNARITALFDATIHATEAAIVNALLAAETMTGRGGNIAYALEPDLLVDALGH